MALAETIVAVLASAQKLKSSGASNEANTKALVIEPLLLALGWNLADIETVEREVKVFEGTFLDYALKVNSVPRLYVEAKGLSGNLADKKFMAQTINYANNDGVIWCVLTNGLQYRVYKTNEPAVMDQKLLFEVDLSDESEPRSQKAKLLGYLSYAAAQDGSLDSFGDRIFTDTRVRQALAQLAKEPPGPFLSAIHEKLGHPQVADDSLLRSLARVLDVAPGVNEGSPAPAASPAAKQPVGPPEPPKGQEYDLEYHFAGKSSLIRELWEATDNYALSLGADVTRRVRKKYIGYFRGKRSFVTVEIQKGRVLVYLSLGEGSAQPWADQVMRDVSQIGHYGMGNIEYSLGSDDQITDLRRLISAAYAERR